MVDGLPGVLAALLAPALVVAISPFSIVVAALVLLHTNRPRANGVSFLIGRLLALAVVTLVFDQAPRMLGGLNRPIRVVASSTVAAPVLVYLVVGARYDAQLNRLKDWIDRHNAAIGAVVMILIGIALLGLALRSL